MTALGRREWVPQASEDYILRIAEQMAGQPLDAIEARIAALTAENRQIHERDCINLNPATNVMNPKAEAVLAAGLGARPSLGYPGNKYEMGLEAIEQIEVIAAELAAEVFGAKYAEIRVPSGAIANLYAFMVAARPGDCIIAPPGEIGGHVTHHGAGAAGLYGIVTHPAPVDPVNYTVDLKRLREDALRLRPKLISIGGSLNLFAHPIREIRTIADEIGALVLFDAAHMSGMIAGHAWQQPLEEGAHLMTMSTYKSLGGPPSGLIVTNDAGIAERLDAVAYPGLTANFDAAKSASLAITLLDWKEHGRAYGQMMAATATALGEALVERQVPVFARDRGITTSHQFAIEAHPYGGGQAAAKKLRAANILSCGIGLPLPAVAGDVNGLRLGTPEIVRFGMTPSDMPELAGYIAEGLNGSRPAEAVAKDVTAFRGRFRGLHYMR
ncbi:serine hydroxymethyltransferase [Bosea sp. PAMC 26642]|uniref:serine hydroxymethyltransferase n=1 Tax=Bosea sp. (strain PAMC 26642) TaxID=1792307 RepID=UPI0007704CD5|nr:aminotransferase class I/II-fold pyridoxal phosphate-dependent enzyme [Bosea sp. PAMC 26642]AMJ60437.1 serine hydroxymethyltransferase [Bosea sp. PAMC 26642]